MEFDKNNLENQLLIETQKGEIERVVELIEKGANINCQDELGNTALHYAVRYGYLEIVRYLIKNGADLNIENSLVETPLDVADKTSRYNIEEIEMILYKKVIDKSFNILENFVAEETSNGLANQSEEDGKREDPKILEEEILKEIKKKERKMRNCLKCLTLLNENGSISNSMLTYEQANHLIYFLDAFAFKDFYVEEPEGSNKGLKLGIQDYFARHIPDFKGGRRLVDELRALLCSCSKTKISIEDISALLSPNIKIINFFRTLERYVTYICNNLDGRPNRNIVFIDITNILYVDETIGSEFSSDNLQDEWGCFIGAIHEEGQWDPEKAQEMLFNFLVNISPAIEKEAETFDKLRNQVMEEFPHLDLKKKLKEVFCINIESHLLFADLLNKVDAQTQKFKSCLDLLKEINKDMDPNCSKFTYKHANVLIFILDALLFEQDGRIGNYLKKLIPSFSEDQEQIRNTLQTLYNGSNKFVSIEDMNKLVASGLGVATFSKKLEAYVIHLCNEINDGPSTDRDAPSINSILDSNVDLGTNSTDVLKENLANLLKTIDSHEEWTKERTHEILFNFRINIPQEHEKVVRGLDSLRKTVINDFYKYKDEDNILKRELTKAVFKFRSLLFRYYYAKEVINIFHKIKPGDDFCKMDADLRHSLIKVEEEFENRFKGESKLNIYSQNGEEDFEHQFFQSSLNSNQEELALQVLTKQYFKYMTIIDDETTKIFYEDPLDCRHFNIRSLFLNEFINLRHLHASSPKKYFEEKKDLRDSLMAYNGVQEVYYNDMCQLYIENDRIHQKEDCNLEEDDCNIEDDDCNLEESGRHQEKGSRHQKESGQYQEEIGQNQEKSIQNQEKTEQNQEESSRKKSGQNEENSIQNQEECVQNQEKSVQNQEESSRKKSGQNEEKSGQNEENSGQNQQESVQNQEKSVQNQKESDRNQKESGQILEEKDCKRDENNCNREDNCSNQKKETPIEQSITNTLLSLRRLQRYYQVPNQDIITLYERVVEANGQFDISKNSDLFQHWVIPEKEKPKFKKLKKLIKKWYKNKTIDSTLNDKIIRLNAVTFISNILNTFYDALNSYNIKFVYVEEAFNDPKVRTNLVLQENMFWKSNVSDHQNYGYYLFMLIKKLLKLKYTEPLIARLIIKEGTGITIEKDDFIKFIEDISDDDRYIGLLNDLLNVHCEGVDLYKIIFKKIFDKNLKSMRPVFEDPDHLEIILKRLQKSLLEESNEKVLILEYNLIKYLNSIARMKFKVGDNDEALELVKVYTKYPLGEKSLAKMELLQGKRLELRIINWLGVLSRRKTDSYVVAIEKQKVANGLCFELKNAFEEIQDNSIEFAASYLLNLSILAYTQHSLEDYMESYISYQNIYQRIKNFVLHNTPVTKLESVQEESSSDFVDIIKSKKYKDLLNYSSEAAEYLDILKIKVSIVWLFIWNWNKNHKSLLTPAKETEFYEESIEQFKEVYTMKRLEHPEDRSVANIMWKMGTMNSSASKAMGKVRDKCREAFRHSIESLQLGNGAYALQKGYADTSRKSLQNIFRVLHDMARNRNSYIGWEGTNAIQRRLDKIREAFVETLQVTKYIQKYGTQN